MKNNWLTVSSEASHELVSHETVEDFLSYYYTQTKSQWPQFSYSWLARETKISKTLLLGVFRGTKSLSARNVQPLMKALKLPPLLADYFEALCVPPQTAVAKKKILKNLRQSYLDSLESSLNVAVSISDADFSVLYAALGDEERGATVEEIMKKINWEEERVRFLLNELQLKKFVRKTASDHWKGTKKFISSVANNKTDWLPKLFASTLERHRKVADKDFFSRDHLSLTYTFCIQDKDFSELNSEIREFMQKLMKKYHDGDGERVVSMVVGVHTN